MRFLIERNHLNIKSSGCTSISLRPEFKGKKYTLEYKTKEKEQRERNKEKLLNVPVDGVESLDTVLRFNPGAEAIQEARYTVQNILATEERSSTGSEQDDNDNCDGSYSEDTNSQSVEFAISEAVDEDLATIHACVAKAF